MNILLVAVNELNWSRFTLCVWYD